MNLLLPREAVTQTARRVYSQSIKGAGEQGGSKKERRPPKKINVNILLCLTGKSFGNSQAKILISKNCLKLKCKEKRLHVQQKLKSNKSPEMGSLTQKP